MERFFYHATGLLVLLILLGAVGLMVIAVGWTLHEAGTCG